MAPITTVPPNIGKALHDPFICPWFAAENEY